MLKFPHYVPVLLLFAVTRISSTHLQCLYCNDAVTPTDCDTVVKCGPHERCYVDAFVSATGSIRYNLGCRDEAQCGSSSGLGKRAEVVYKSGNKANIDAVLDADVEPLKHNPSGFNRRTQLRTGTRNILSERSNGLLICSECCTGDLCNNAGCGNTGYISPRGPICFNCAEQKTPEDCSKIRLCGQDEVCMLLKTINPMSHEVRYSTKCEGEKRCKNQILKFKEIATLLIGKRRKRDSLEIGGSCLVQCCTTDMCNVNCGNNSTSTRGPTTTHTQLTTISPKPSSPQPTTNLVYQTPSSPPSAAAFCIYKSKIYNQGDVWQDGCQYNCTCEDARTGFYRCQDRCPAWNNLPAGCTLEKKPGECCSQPNCGGQILTPGGIANTCYHGNKYYHEGDQWRDGCKYKCTCQVRSTGFYQCQPLCLQWSLPPSCHLKPAPAGKCCQMPVCPSNVQLQFPPGFVQE